MTLWPYVSLVAAELPSQHRSPRPSEARLRSAYFLARPRVARTPCPLENPDVLLRNSSATSLTSHRPRVILVRAKPESPRGAPRRCEQHGPCGLLSLASAGAERWIPRWGIRSDATRGARRIGPLRFHGPSLWVLVSSIFIGMTSLAAEPAVDHAPWDALLHRYVRGGLVNYAGVKTDRAVLNAYLASLATIDPAQLPSKNAQLAFWINAYNASVFTGVLDHLPIRSVRDVKGFFDGIRYQIGGQSLTVNEIEAKGRALGDWRIHVAVVCASASCPPIRDEAYVPERLDAQLAEQLTQFFRHPTTGLRLEGDTLWVSKIFDWYARDFFPDTRLFTKLTPEKFVAAFQSTLDPYIVQAVRERKFVLKFLDYDWTLNGQSTQVPPLQNAAPSSQ